MSDDKKYQVYEDDGDEHGYTRLSKLETDSMIEALSYLRSSGAKGVMVVKPHNGFVAGQELSSAETKKLFFEEMKILMDSADILKIRELMGNEHNPPPPELLDFMRKNFQVEKPNSILNKNNPYAKVVAHSGDKSNLLLADTMKETLP